jgi:16S rRNA (guanine527-N7)-methyltransferase
VEIKELLKKGLEESGFIPSNDQLSAFMTYLSELKKWNKAYNLTGLKKDEDIIIKHFLDSLLYLRAMPGGETKIADAGSGAGFPGIPLKIMRPDSEMYLIDPSQKKTAFLRHIIRQIALEKIEVLESRIEEVKVNRDLPLPADIAVTRALFDVKEFIKKAAHIVKQNGTLILNKGPKVKGELKRLRGVDYELQTVTLPLTEITRYLVIVKVSDKISG